MKTKLHFTLVILFVILLPACTTPTTPPTATALPTTAATESPTETALPTATQTPLPTVTHTPTVEPTATLAPGEIIELPEDSADWQELEVYSTTSAETGEEVEVIVYQGEAIEISRELVNKEGEVMQGFYDWDEITAELGFQYGIEQSGEKVKMGAYMDAIVLDASEFDDHGWLLVGMRDSEGGMHKVLLSKGNYHYFLQSLDEQGQVSGLVARGYALNQTSQDLPDNGTQVDLSGYAAGAVTKVAIKPGDRIGFLLELAGPVNSTTYQRYIEFTETSFSTVQEAENILRDNYHIPPTVLGEEDGLIITGLIVPAENTE